MCTFAVNKTIQYYKNSKVPFMLLDASQAFDTVNYSKLFGKLLAKGLCATVTHVLIKIFIYTPKDVHQVAGSFLY